MHVRAHNSTEQNHNATLPRGAFGATDRQISLRKFLVDQGSDTPQPDYEDENRKPGENTLKGRF